MAARWCDDVCGFHRRRRGGAMMTEGEVIRRRRSCIAMLSDLSDWSDSSDGPWCYQQARLWLRGGAMMCVASTEGCAVVR